MSGFRCQRVLAFILAAHAGDRKRDVSRSPCTRNRGPVHTIEHLDLGAEREARIRLVQRLLVDAPIGCPTGFGYHEGTGVPGTHGIVLSIGAFGERTIVAPDAVRIPVTRKGPRALGRAGRFITAIRSDVI